MKPILSRWSQSPDQRIGQSRRNPSPVDVAGCLHRTRADRDMVAVLEEDRWAVLDDSVGLRDGREDYVTLLHIQRLVP